MYPFSTLKKKALDAGYSIQHGYQRYLHKGWGYVVDPGGNRCIGYQIRDNRTGLLVYPSNSDLWDHALSEAEAIELLHKLIG